MRQLTTRLKEEVLNERREHVPGLSMHDRSNEVETVGGDQRDDDVTERRICLNNAGENHERAANDDSGVAPTEASPSSPRQYVGQRGIQCNQHTRA